VGEALPILSGATGKASMHLETTLRWLRADLQSALIAVGAAALLAVIFIGIRRWLAGFARRREGAGTWLVAACDLVGKTKAWFIVALAARLVVQFMDIPTRITAAIAFLFIIAATLQVAIWVRALALDIIEQRATAGGTDQANLGSAINIIRLLLTVAVFAIAAIIVLDNIGVNVTGLVAGLGVGGIAIGLAAQGIFSDLFAALSIIFDKPFRVGDVITYQGKEGPVTGTVEEIGLKSTRIRALTGELRIISNANLLNQEVTNYVGRAVYRFSLKVGVTYQTPADVAVHIPDIMRAEVEKAGLNFIRAAFTGFGPSSLDYDMLFDVETDNIADANRAFQQVGLAIYSTFNDRGIDFAYPTQTTFTAAPDGRMVMPYPDISVLKQD
jgi:small-conductance mechanosensitive channel